MKKVVLLNAISCTEEVKQHIKKAFQHEDYELIESQYAGHLTQAARTYNNSVLFSVGGDGTLLEVINGAAETDNSVFVVPAGSGNDFCKMLTKEKDYKKVLSDIKSYSIKQLDCGRADDTYFANIASVGYDAEIVKNASKFKKIPLLRKISYIISIFYTLFTYKPLKLKITIDGQVFEQEFLLAAFANGQFYGGGVHVAPTAETDDGYFDVYLADAMSKTRIIAILPKLLNGSHIHHKAVKVIRAKEITIESDSPFLLNLDGELSETTSSHIKIIEKGARFFCQTT